MTKKLLVVDADTILYASSAQQQLNKCLATNIEYGSQRLFESKTAFNEWAKENNRDKANYSFETISEIKPDAEPRFAFQAIKQKVDNIVQAAGCDDYVLCIEGEGNFRKDFKSKFVDYKGQRSPKPILFEECREFFLKKYKKKVILSEGRETDDTCNILAWDSYNKGVASKDRSKCDVVLAYCDKDLAANSRGWMLNYNKLEEGIFWNDSFTQSYNFATQLLTGDNADNIPGIEKLSKITKERFNIKVEGVGPATAKKILADCKTEKDLAGRAYECYSAMYGEEEGWEERLYENGFFLYLLRHEKDRWDLDRYLEGTIYE
jgi:hypothetical protein